MNVFALSLPSSQRPLPAVVIASVRAATARTPRTRDFGVGYGNSSGYVRARSYAGTTFAPRFRIS
ncbi:hypothetical protein [Luteimonas sp. R10]|uniref:hypothetical protein n=1 Tax=Luteimonas sp. R10 TaxID=3108176 RepID=UPI003089162F|nr:hypothetical protein U3649_03890 [Luteimonas sp. R10]